MAGSGKAAVGVGQEGDGQTPQTAQGPLRQILAVFRDPTSLSSCSAELVHLHCSFPSLTWGPALDLQMN